MSQKRAFITGITGQDGAYLARLLLDKNYEVHGLSHHGSSAHIANWRLKWIGIADRVTLHHSDLTDLTSLVQVLGSINPLEIYNLAAQSSVKQSWEKPSLTGLTTGIGTAAMLDATRLACPKARFFQASSSEILGDMPENIQSEKPTFSPKSPYAVAKLYAHWMTVTFREGFGLHASNGILFNHESPLREIEFVTRKITDGVARIKLRIADKLMLGNLDATRDWGHARDFVRAMWLMLQQDNSDDYIIATGRIASVRQFCELAFKHVNLRMDEFVSSDPRYLRPSDHKAPPGNAIKARQVLGWTAETTLEQLVAEMVDADLDRLRRAQGFSSGSEETN